MAGPPAGPLFAECSGASAAGRRRGRGPASPAETTAGGARPLVGRGFGSARNPEPAPAVGRAPAAPPVTYLEFHLAFTLPPLAVLALLQGRTRERWWPLALLVGIAFVYTTPWDNYLVARGVWSYPPGRVLATVGWVPVEEYAFFVIQTLMAGLWLRLFQARWPAPPEPPGDGASGADLRARVVGTAVFLALSLAGAAMVVGAGHWLYLGLILAWACPVLALMWGVGGHLVWARRRLVAVTVVPVSLYLWAADWFAITQAGIWEITDATRTGAELFRLPVEEALFFAVTSLLVAQGLVMLETPAVLGPLARRQRAGAAA